MPQPAMLTFNELNGEEVREILENRCRDTFDRIPQFQRHMTLPRVRITLNVKLEVWADQPNPETINIGDSLTVVVDRPPEIYRAQSVDTAAPIPGGHPPDQIREQHGLPTSRPSRGAQNIGAQFSIADEPIESPVVTEPAPGVRITREAGGTVVELDQGPAGLQHGMMNRDRLTWKQQGVPPRKQR